MNYRNSEMKIDQLVSYLNEEKINLSPAFQRGHVWAPKTRRKLIQNIVQGKPIPAIFLYKEAVGSKYSYNILDGKQRLESLILFIANQRQDVKIPNWSRYFFNPALRESAEFSITLPEGKRRFENLADDVVRDFREYSIPTIEISLDDESSLDEVITLFVDINQQGEPVKRFDIIKAMYKGDPLLKNVFSLLAVEERRGQDIFYKAKNNDITAVLKKLQVVDSVGTPNSKVDKMWEKLLEIASFVRTRKHRKPVEILKEFITTKKTPSQKLNKTEIKIIRSTFGFLRTLLPSLGNNRLFVDQTHSYTLVTSLIRTDLLSRFGDKKLKSKITKFAKILEKDAPAKGSDQISDKLTKYREYAAKQTTDASRRIERDRLLVEMLEVL